MPRGGEDLELLEQETDSSWIRYNLSRLGLELYEVGGSIRAELLGMESPDIDVCVVGVDYSDLQRICSNAGLEVSSLSVAGQDIGVRINGDWTPRDGIEIALARREVSSGPSHRDFLIETDPSVLIEEDLLRRDFTCNALARKIMPDGSLGEIIDPCGGELDLKKGVLRAVSKRSIADDPLRTLRGLVRVARDGLDIDPDTLAEMRRFSAAISPAGTLSSERVWRELEKIISGNFADRAFALMMQDRGVLWGSVFPEFADMVGFDQQSKYHDLDLSQHSLLALRGACREDLEEVVRWAALLHDCGKPESSWMGEDGRLHYYQDKDVPESQDHALLGAEKAARFLHRIGAPLSVQKEVPELIRHHMFKYPSSQKQSRSELRARQWIQSVGRARVDNLLALRRCDWRAKGSDLSREEEIERGEQVIRSQINQPLEICDLEISGQDVLQTGAQGREVGLILQELLRRVVACPEQNSRELLLKWSRSLQEKNS